MGLTPFRPLSPSIRTVTSRLRGDWSMVTPTHQHASCELESAMKKLLKNEQIVCENGHFSGYLLRDVEDNRPLTADDFVSYFHATHPEDPTLCRECGHKFAISE